MDSLFSIAEQDRDQSIESRRKKRRRIETVSSEHPSSSDQIRWRSSAEHSAYSSKLVEALRRVCRISSPSSAASSRSRFVRETADKVLAIAARGRSRWSRAILAKRLKHQLKNHKKAAKSTNPPASTGNRRFNRLSTTGSQIRPKAALPPLQRRVRILSHLVPGCRKLSFPNLLQEATDYISALEMQVRVMSEFAELLAGAEVSSRFSSISNRPDLS